ncbi:MAG: EAL domain-containing protein [Campylobacterales bacterium]|nr:EAL domain-containing protein [Campylobacterales bacterium]
MNWLKSKMYSGVTHVAMVLLAGAVALGWLNHNRVVQEKNQLEKSQSTFELAYRSSVQMYALIAEQVLDMEIQKPAVLALLKRGAEAPTDALRDEVRHELLLILGETYAILQKSNLSHVQFHLPSGHTLLRFHAPHRHSDSLLETRPLVRYAHETQQSVQGFEVCTSFFGYRFIYPLFSEGVFVGTLEMGVPAASFLRTLYQLDPSRRYAFVVDTTIAEALLREEHAYTPIPLHGRFGIEVFHGAFLNQPEEEIKLTRAISVALSRDTAFRDGLEKGESFSVYARVKEAFYGVTLLPLGRGKRGVEGFFLSYQYDMTPLQLWKDFGLVLGLSGAWGGVIFVLLFGMQRHARRARAQHEKIQTLYDTLAEGVFVVDKSGVIVDVNAATCTLLGYTKEEMFGKEVYLLFSMHSQKATSSIRCALMQHHVFSSDQECFTCKDGKKIAVEIQAKPLAQEGKEAVMVVTFYDITARKESEQHMRLLTQALEASANAIVITNQEAVIQWANPAFERLTGFSTGEALGQKPKDLLYSGKQAKTFYEAMWSTILSGTPWHGELINRKKDGTFYCEELSITPMVNGLGKIEHFIAIKQDITARKEHEDKIHSLAFFDVLTGLPNRRLLEERLKSARLFAKRYGKYAAVLFLDLDKFKLLNDTRGHDVGDVFLQHVASRIQATLRESDMVARFGGDEFVVVLEGLDNDRAQATLHVKRLAKNLHDALNAPYMLKEKEYKATVSIGATLFQGEDKEEVLKRADIALYEAKDAGRDQTYVYDNALHQLTREREQLEDALRRGVREKKGFVLLYQPKVNAQEIIVGAEVFLRWNHPALGCLVPKKFLMIAEETGLIEPLGAWVFEEVAKEMQGWKHTALEPLHVSINVGEKQLCSEYLVPQISKAFEGFGEGLGRVRLDVQEATFLQYALEMKANMEQLFAMGVRFSLDGYGNSLASFRHLRSLPFDEVKVGRLVMEDASEDAALILQTVLTLSHNAKMNVVAEQVETSEQRERLERSGCKEFQGYLFGKPMSKDAFHATVTTQHASS